MVQQRTFMREEESQGEVRVKKNLPLCCCLSCNNAIFSIVTLNIFFRIFNSVNNKDFLNADEVTLISLKTNLL